MIKESDLVKLQLYYLKNQRSPLLVDIIGESMLPILKEGFKVKIIPVDAGSVNCGDIVLFRGKKMICHRVIGKFKWRKEIYFIQIGEFTGRGGVFNQAYLVGKVIEVYDKSGNKIDEDIWQKSIPALPSKIFSFGYFILFTIKRFLFGRKQNGLTRIFRIALWRFSRCLYGDKRRDRH